MLNITFIYQAAILCDLEVVVKPSVRNGLQMEIIDSREISYIYSPLEAKERRGGSMSDSPR